MESQRPKLSTGLTPIVAGRESGSVIYTYTLQYPGNYAGFNIRRDYRMGKDKRNKTIPLNRALPYRNTHSRGHAFFLTRTGNPVMK